METNPNHKKSPSSKPDKKQSQVLKYSGLAFELFAIIGIGSYAGYRLDLYLENKIPYWLITLMLLSTGVAIYSLYRKLPKD